VSVKVPLKIFRALPDAHNGAAGSSSRRSKKKISKRHESEWQPTTPRADGVESFARCGRCGTG